jgi:hypothetical protein
MHQDLANAGTGSVSLTGDLKFEPDLEEAAVVIR